MERVRAGHFTRCVIGCFLRVYEYSVWVPLKRNLSELYSGKQRHLMADWWIAANCSLWQASSYPNLPLYPSTIIKWEKKKKIPFYKIPDHPGLIPRVSEISYFSQSRLTRRGRQGPYRNPWSDLWTQSNPFPRLLVFNTQCIIKQIPHPDRKKIEQLIARTPPIYG